MTDIFSPKNTANAIHATLGEAFAAIPEGRSHAVIFDGTYTEADGPEGRVLYVQRAADGWDVILGGGYTVPTGVSGRVAVAKSW